MDESPTLLCAVDTSAAAATVAGAARTLAEAMGARLTLVHVFDPDMVPVARTREEHLSTTAEEVEEHWRDRACRAFAKTVGDLGGGVEDLMVDGRPAEEIVRLAGERRDRLIICGAAPQRPVDRLLEGSVSSDVLAQAPCPVVVVPDDAVTDADGPLLVGLDGSAHSRRAAGHAVVLAAHLGRDVVLMEVDDARDREPARADEAFLRELDDLAPLGKRRPELRATSVEGEPVRALSVAARDLGASAVVVGSRGRNAVSAALLGSVSIGLIADAGRPVVVAGPLSPPAA